MIRGAHDQIERRLRPSVLEHKTKELFVVYAPLIVSGAGSHLVAAVNFIKPLFATKLADPLPAQKSAIKKSRAITEPLENFGRSRWHSFAHDRLVIDQHARERQSGDENAQTLDRADARRNEAVRVDILLAERFDTIR